MSGAERWDDECAPRTIDIDALLAAAGQRAAFLDDRLRGEPIIRELMAALKQERERYTGLSEYAAKTEQIVMRLQAEVARLKGEA